MAESLKELLAPSLESEKFSWDSNITTYLNKLQSSSLDALTDSEPDALAQSSHKLLLSLQTLSTKSHAAIIASSDSCETFTTSLPTLGKDLHDLQYSLPQLDRTVNDFSRNYGKSAENELLNRRKNAMLLLRNSERLSDILELPSLLTSAIQTTSGLTSSGNAPQSSGVNYGSALDLHAHTRRLHTLYPGSSLVADVTSQAEQAMQTMTTNLIASLKSSNVKLAGGIKTVGWLRRIAPELDGSRGDSTGTKEGTMGALFIVCRLANLLSMLEALDPLRELAEAESMQRESKESKNAGSWAGGQQTEKYLKRYIEVFREQSFAIISMYRSIFPSGSQEAAGQRDGAQESNSKSDTLQQIPSPLSTFPLHLTSLLIEVLTRFLPNVRDKTSKESLLTQVLYCAGSLGRLGGDFSMLLALLEEDMNPLESDDEQPEDWVGVIRKHRVLASRLELLANGVGSGLPARSPAKETLAVR